MLDIVGWVGAFCFSICALPQAYQSFRFKHSYGLNLLFLFNWFVGESCMLFYSLVKLGDIPLIVNYLFNLLCLLVIIYYRLFPKSNND